MKVFIKNKWDLVYEDSEVKNEKGEPEFFVRGNYFSLSKKKEIYGKDGTLLYIVKNRYFNLLSHKVCIDDADGNRVASIKKSIFGITGNYKIFDTDGEMLIEGVPFGRTSFIMRNGQEVATLKKDFTFVCDSYSLDADEKDIPFFTALVIALDNLRDKRRR